MDPLFAQGFLVELMKRFNPVLRAHVEALIVERGFDALCCGFLLDPRPLNLLAEAVTHAMVNCRRLPAQVNDVRRSIYQRFSLENQRKT